MHLIWVLIGAGLAYLFLKTQRWSAMIINPEFPRLSKLLIVGGAVVRWLFVFLILVSVLSYSTFAMLIVFFTFMIARLLILLKWQGMIYAR